MKVHSISVACKATDCCRIKNNFRIKLPGTSLTITEYKVFYTVYGKYNGWFSKGKPTWKLLSHSKETLISIPALRARRTVTDK